MTTLVLRPFQPMRRRHFALMRQMAVLQHRLLDQSTMLGYLWSLLHPLLLLAVLYAFFSQRVGAALPNYGVFLLIGLVQFTHFSRTIASAMRILHRMRGVAVGVIFPKDVLIYSSLLKDLPEFLISMGATAAIAVVTGVPFTWTLAALPVVIGLQLLLVTWISILLAILYVFVRDLDHIYEVGMRVLFFATPILYSLDFLPSDARRIALLNPLTHLIGYSRRIVLEGQLPAGAELLAFLIVNSVLMYIAVSIFRRAEPALIERL
jgi:ABC-type polysaccharide/polyol phosphate export permease